MAATASEAAGIRPAERKPYMRYDPLPNGYVRLLEIQPALNTEDIEDEMEISLISVPLAECPPYVALSYTWGEPGPFVDATTVIFTKVLRCYPIKCDDRLILCTRNLRNALRRLRQIDNLQRLASIHSVFRAQADVIAEYNNNVHLYWIDAICINQEDVQERSRQVLLMGRIYRQARCTFVWLGEEDTYTRPAMEALWKVVSDQPMPETDAPNRKVLTRSEGIGGLDDTQLEALAMLTARNWMLRTWILQEVVLSKLVLTLCGSLNFPFDMLLEVLVILSSVRQPQPEINSVLTKRGLVDPALGEKIQGAWWTLGRIRNCRRIKEEKEKIKFSDTVLMSQHSESTDPRDNVFGILGMATEFEFNGEEIYKVDYKQTVTQIYSSVTAFVITKRGDLASLNLVCDCSQKQIENLPSWCPDYGTTTHQPLRDVGGFERTWHLGLQWSDALDPNLINLSILRVDGFLFDIVAETATLLKTTSDTLADHGLSAVCNLATRLDIEDALVWEEG